MEQGIIYEKTIRRDRKKLDKGNYPTIDTAVKDCSVVMSVTASPANENDNCDLTCRGHRCDCGTYGSCTHGECMCYRD